MTRQCCDLPLCESPAVAFDDESGFRCAGHASAEAVVSP